MVLPPTLMESGSPPGLGVVLSPSQNLGPEVTTELGEVWVLAVFIQHAVW